MIQDEHKSMIRLKNIFFTIYFSSLLILTITPTFYLNISGSRYLILGIPLPFFYWIAIAFMLMVGLSIMYLLEDKFGEIPGDQA